MPWSYKKAKHGLCDGQGCSECEKGKIDQLAYLPVFMYHHGPLSAILQVGQEPTLEILTMAAVRTDAPQTIHVTPPSTSIKEGTFTTAQMKDEVCDDTLKAKIEDFIRANMEGNRVPTFLNFSKKKDTYLVSTTSKYCENLKENMALIMSGSSSVVRRSFRNVFVFVQPSGGDVMGSVKTFVGDGTSFHRVSSRVCTRRRKISGSVQRLGNE